MIPVTFFSHVEAQQQQTATVYIYREQGERLTIFVPGVNDISMRNFTFEVKSTDGKIRDVFKLESYTSFNSLNFDRLNAPLCFTLVREQSTSSLPKDCENIKYIYSHSLPQADVFWYDYLAHRAKSIDIVSSSSSVIATCGAESPVCQFLYDYVLLPDNPNDIVNTKVADILTQQYIQTRVAPINPTDLQQTVQAAVEGTNQAASAETRTAVALLPTSTPQSLPTAAPLPTISEPDPPYDEPTVESFPDISGDWVGIQTVSGPPGVIINNFVMHLTQDGSKITGTIEVDCQGCASAYGYINAYNKFQISNGKISKDGEFSYREGRFITTIPAVGFWARWSGTIRLEYDGTSLSGTIVQGNVKADIYLTRR
jgi:hypothetical protein